MKSHQETFDIVAKALLKQGQKSGINDKCFYRGPDGLKCAAGHLIPDDLYDPKMESFDCFISNKEIEKYYIPKQDQEMIFKISKILENQDYDSNFVRILQKIHDNIPSFNEYDDNGATWLEEWKDDMIEFAKENNFSLEVFNLC